MERVVLVAVGDAVVQDDETFPAGFGNPVQAAVEADGFGEVVVLDQVDPGQGRREHVLKRHRGQPHDEVAARQRHIIDLVADVEAEVRRRAPRRVCPDERILSVVVLTGARAHESRDRTMLRRAQADEGVGPGVLSGRDDDGR